MITNPPRTILAAVLAVASLSFAAGPVAHAETNTGGSGSASGGCGSMENGEVRTYKRRYERGTVTCKNGTRCETRKVKQGDGSWKTFKECKKAPAMERPAPQDDARAPVTDAAASPVMVVAAQP